MCITLVWFTAAPICVMLLHFIFELGRGLRRMSNFKSFHINLSWGTTDVHTRGPEFESRCLWWRHHSVFVPVFHFRLFFPSLIGLLFGGLFQTYHISFCHLSLMHNIGRTLCQASVFQVLGCEKSCIILSSCMKARLFQSTKTPHYSRSDTEKWNTTKLVKIFRKK